jgi:predicted DNA-binding transcriptional regulator YafY
LNRIDRLAAIQIQLQSRTLVKAKDIAEKFDITLRTVYRDIKALEQAGVPIIGEAGIGYRLMEGYKLPPVMFTEDEATALLTASKLVNSKTDAGISKYYNSALDKIRAILRYSEKEHIQGIDEHIAVTNHPSVIYEPEKQLHLQSILKAISGSRVIDIIYSAIEKNEDSQRMIEPIGVYHMGSHWYLVAWCRMRNDYRNFRTDRIKRLTITSETFSTKHPPLQSFINKTSAEKELFKIVIDVEKDIVKYLGEQKYYHGFLSEEKIDDKVRLTFLTASPMGFARWFMVFGDHAKIIEPLNLNKMVGEIAGAIVASVSSPS